MTDSDDDEGVLHAASPLMLAREYWTNAIAIGAPGSPNMVEAAQLQMQHAAMAQSAAVLSVAESLHKVAVAVAQEQRDLHVVARNLDSLAKELTKIRTGRR